MKNRVNTANVPIGKVMSLLLDNYEWIFSGIGVFVIGYFLNRWRSRAITTSTVSITNNIHTPHTESATLADAQQDVTNSNLTGRKASTNIVFIDDDTKFKVVKILASSGWTNTSIIRDAKTLDDPTIVNADILFVDIQGVGIELGFSSEGLGLALALKEKYPNKKIVIYSAETKGERFHDALRKADSFLAKNADPYEFQKLVEELSLDIRK